MAIKLTQEQVFALAEHQGGLIWRPRGHRIVHIKRLTQPTWAVEAVWTFCNELRPAEPAVKPWSWYDPFCERCVKAALK